MNRRIPRRSFASVHFRNILLTTAALLAAALARAQAPPAPPVPSPSPTPAATPSPAAGTATVVAPAAVPPEATPPTPAPAPCDPTKGDVCVNAERLRRNEKDHLSWEGFVDLQFGDGRIQAEQLDLYTEPKPDGTTSRRVEASGNVVFLRGQERLSGQSLKMDLTTGKGTFENAIGYAEPGVFVEAKSIERVDPHTYRINGGKFTSCCQPNPRWNFSASSATLKVDDKITAKNVVFRAKAVPAFYLPYFVYPIEQDQRSTGFLFPHFGQSSVRGFNVGGAFFWAMGRSLDQTFYADNFTKYGYGFGHELRYALPSPSRGTFRTYLLRRSEGGAWEHDFNWTAAQLLPGRVRANLQVQETSNVTFQEQINDSLDYASQRTRRSSLSLQRAFGRNNVALQADSTDTFFPEADGTVSQVTQRHLPLLKLSGSPQKNRATGLVFSYEGRGENIENTDPGGSSKYARYDANPRLSRPFSLSFLQLTPEVQVRGTRYSKTDVAGAGTTGPPVNRNYVEANVDMRGPTFSKVFDTEGNFYSDRYKHVIGPEVTFTRRAGIDPEVFATIPKFDQHDWLVDTNEVRYSLVQRFYAKRPGRSGKLDAIEFFNWRVSQTYYLDIAASQFDPNYNYENLVLGPGGVPTHYSPLRSQMRFRPNDFITSTFTLQYDVSFKQVRNFDLSTGVEYPTFRFDAGWSRGNQVARNPENRRRTYDTLRGSSRWAVLPGRLALEAGADYNILDKKLLRVSGVLRYDIQCVGFLIEYIRSEYGARNGERQFRFSVELANIGSMGNFMGQKPGSSGFR
jgi:lipopolysaccharide assembly outer membrane protein LptD (OstA)